MQIMEILEGDDWKRSKKRESLNRILAKLVKTRNQIESDLVSEVSDKRRKMLSIKLRTNIQHLLKAKRFIAELDKTKVGRHWWKTWICRLQAQFGVSTWKSPSVE